MDNKIEKILEDINKLQGYKVTYQYATAINIKDNNIIIDLAKINSEAILYNTSISDVYIKDKALYIIGTNLDMYLNA